jgi:ribose 5-phosphate isomerase B
VVSSDHAGYDLKISLMPFIESLGYDVEDVGTFSKEPVDYPVFTAIAAQKVASRECGRGIIFCGTGQGDAIAANKVAGIRAALCWNEYTARMSRAHNDANMLVLGGWVTAPDLAKEIVRVWLTTGFEGGRHERRISEITDIERQMALNRGKTYDITLPIRLGMLLWPGDEPVVFQQDKGDGVASTTNIKLCAHTGTHLDGPCHMFQDAGGTESLELDNMLGLACVCSLQNKKIIDRETLEGINFEGISRLLLKTDNSDLLVKSEFCEDYVFITEDAAAYIIQKGIKFIALDYLSVDSYDSLDYPAHKMFLASGVIVAEGVDLRNVPPGIYEMLCLPLKLENCDGAPARIVLRTICK